MIEQMKTPGDFQGEEVPSPWHHVPTCWEIHWSAASNLPPFSALHLPLRGEMSYQWIWRQNRANLAQAPPLSFLWGLLSHREHIRFVLYLHGLRFAKAAPPREASDGAAVPTPGCIAPQRMRRMALVSPVSGTSKP